MKGENFNAMDEARNGSADSGQSSSPDTGSSSASIADSLEDNHHQQQEQSRGGPKGGKLSNRLDEDDVLTIKNYQDAAALSKSVTNNNNITNDTSSDIIKNTTPTIKDASGEVPAKNNSLSGKENTLNTTTSENTKVETSQLEKSPFHQDSLKQETKQQQQVNNPTTTNNNYSGLNLNMTASEMRELIARRKKFDPKKAQMNIRQKYEIIQQM